jgi:antitoxin (DNA-binding transcriptional repressor) of toxin-antitoxin stability system
MIMSHYSVVEAKNHLSDLINRSLGEEPVIVPRHGHPVVEAKAVQRAGRRITSEDMDWLAARRVEMNSTVDAGTLVSRMRDDEEGEPLPRRKRCRCAIDERCLYASS